MAEKENKMTDEQRAEVYSIPDDDVQADTNDVSEETTNRSVLAGIRMEQEWLRITGEEKVPYMGNAVTLLAVVTEDLLKRLEDLEVGLGIEAKHE